MKRIRLWVLMSLALFAACAHRVTVAEVRRDPDAFRGKTVAIRGTVRGATKLPFMAEGFFRLEDGADSLVVITRGAMPVEGKATTVKGKVEPGFEIGGKTYGLVLITEDR